VGRTSTIALCNATLPYAVEIASKGYEKAAARIRGSRRGLTWQWEGDDAAVADAVKMKLQPVK